MNEKQNNPRISRLNTVINVFICLRQPRWLRFKDNTIIFFFLMDLVLLVWQNFSENLRSGEEAVMVSHLLTHYTRETNKLVEVDKCGHGNDLQKGLVLATLARLGVGGVHVWTKIFNKAVISPRARFPLQESRTIDTKCDPGIFWLLSFYCFTISLKKQKQQPLKLASLITNTSCMFHVCCPIPKR